MFTLKYTYICENCNSCFEYICILLLIVFNGGLFLPQDVHVEGQLEAESFRCLWVGCKVYEKASCSVSWLERHVLTHGGHKPFKCIVEGCGHRFTSQVRHEHKSDGTSQVRLDVLSQKCKFLLILYDYCGPILTLLTIIGNTWFPHGLVVLFNTNSRIFTPDSLYLW